MISMTNVAAGYLPAVHVLCNDYLTPDGTVVRDYIHVVDLAQEYLAALELLNKRPGWDAINLGMGQGASVFDMIKVFSLITGKDIPDVLEGRRSNDVASCYASVQKAVDLMALRVEKSLQDMYESAWRWQRLK
jgi:UDP-glucose 4-epimerase